MRKIRRRDVASVPSNVVVMVVGLTDGLFITDQGIATRRAE